MIIEVSVSEWIILMNFEFKDTLVLLVLVLDMIYK